jgi:hypothetical protein
MEVRKWGQGLKATEEGEFVLPFIGLGTVRRGAVLILMVAIEGASYRRLRGRGARWAECRYEKRG